MCKNGEKCRLRVLGLLLCSAFCCLAPAPARADTPDPIGLNPTDPAKVKTVIGLAKGVG